MDDLYLNRHAQQEPAPVNAGFVRNTEYSCHFAYSRHSEYSRYSREGGNPVTVSVNRLSRDTPRHSREGGNPSLLAIATVTRMQTCLFASLETEREKVYG
jgi:hypothetical protein